MSSIKPQDERIFRSRFSVVLLTTGCAILVAALLADLFWGRMFEAIYGVSVADPGVAGRETNPLVMAEYAALKPMLNLIMYVVPTTLGFIGAGFFLTGAGLAAVDSLADRWQAWCLKRHAAE